MLFTLTTNDYFNMIKSLNQCHPEQLLHLYLIWIINKHNTQCSKTI